MKASFKVALAMAGVCLAGRAQAQTVVVGPQAGSMALLQGAQVTVPIVADLTGSGGASLGSATLRLVWHPGVLAFRGVSGGALGQPVVNADSAGGSLRVAVANPAGVTGQPVLFSATFAVVGAPGAADTLQLQLQELTRATTFADLLPFGVSTAGHVCVSTGLWGDLNADTFVNGADALTILTHAVGLPITPYTVVNGDVDGDGQVNTRDALIVLTYAVALPVDGFRVGVMNPGGCSVQAAASVQIQPRNAAVAVGDQFPLAATVRDSAGAAVQGLNLVWTSADTTIVKADGTGHLVGVHAGTALVFAIAAPGLKDSATVTVDSLRHVWWVNPALAALNGGVEIGSQTYPYSGIGQAVARAAAFDTVRIAPATYGDTLRLTKGLTLLGDSTAAGMPIIRNPAGPGIQVGPLGAGFVRLDHLRIEDSQGGLLVNGADSVLLRWVSVERSLDVGIGITNAGRVVLDHTAVQGAVGKAITMTAVPKVRLHAVFVDQVTTTKLSGNDQAVGIEIAAGADSVVGDSLALLTGGMWLDSARVALFDGVQTALTNGAGVAAVIGDAFALDNADIKDAYSNQTPGTDSVPAVAVLLRGTLATARFTNTVIRHSSRNGLIVLGGDSVLASGLVIQDIQTFNGATPAMFQGTRRVVLYGSAFLDNNGGVVSFEDPANAMLVTVDSSMFRGTNLRAHHSALLDVRRSQFQGGFQSPNQQDAAVMADSVRLVSLLLVDLGGLQLQPVDPSYGGPFGVNVYWADSLDIRHVSIHDNPFGAVICHSCRAVVADTSEFLRNGQFPGFVSGAIGTVVLEGPTFVRVHAVQIDGGGFAGLWLRSAGMAGHFSVDSSAFVGDSMSLVYVDYFANFVSGDSLAVTRSSFRGRNHGGFGVQAYNTLAGLTVSGSAFDSTSYGVGSYLAGPTTVHGNRFTGVGFGLDAENGSDVVFDSNTVDCADPASGEGVSLYAVGGWVTRNVITRCLSGVWSQNQWNTRGLVVVGNTISSDSSVYSNGLIDIADSYDSLVVSGNVVHGGRGQGVQLYGNYYGIGAARVDSNSVQGIQGNGIVLGGIVASAVGMTYNLIGDNDTNGVTTFVHVIGSYNTVVRNKQLGVDFASTSPDTFRLGNYVGNGHYGVYKASSPGFVLADSSYWGRPEGPRCYTVCDSTPGVTGDSVGLAPFVVYDSIATSVVTAAPADPGPPAAPVFRAARLHVALPTHLAVRLQPARPQGAAAARPGQRPRPAAPVSPRRVRP